MKFVSRLEVYKEVILVFYDNFKTIGYFLIELQQVQGQKLVLDRF